MSLEKLNSIVKTAGVDAIALIPSANLHFVTGQEFHLMERPLVVFFKPGQDPVAVLPALEQDRMADSPVPCQLVPWTDSEGYEGAFEAAAAAFSPPLAKIGVEEMVMRIFEANLIETAFPGVRIVPAGDALAGLRMHKDANALAAMREAVRISEAALQATLDTVQPGMTEREITNILVQAQLQRGGGKNPFEPIVLSGPRSALPHGEPSDRAVQAGEPLLLDFGTTVHGYASDITRTVCVGQPSDKLAEVYSIVQQANAAGRAAVQPGVTAEEVDRITRAVIEDAGYGAYFTHRTGHGLGLETHELPNIVAGNATVLEPGMTFTIEPGIYLPGELGVRIEDNVVVTTDGAESLTTFPRDLMSIG